jgi:hypothetical protein
MTTTDHLRSQPKCPNRWHERVERHRAFWRREPGSGPLIGFAPRSHLFPVKNLAIEHEGRFHAHDVTDAVIDADIGYRPRFRDDDGLMPAKIPLEPLAFAEGYVGARVFLSSRVGAFWAEPPEPAPRGVNDLEDLLEPAWLTRLVYATKRNVEAAADQLLITEMLLRGPADCLESLIGGERLCLGLLDRPEVLRDMALWLADRLIELYDAQLAVLPRPPVGTGSPDITGTVNRYRVWGPGRNIVTQADISGVMSTGHFRDVFQPAYARLAGHFDTATIHFHSSAARHVDVLLEIDELDAIEWGMDPKGPTLEEMVPVFHRILQSKALILMNINSNQETAMLLRRLPHEGLCIIQRTDG